MELDGHIIVSQCWACKTFRIENAKGEFFCYGTDHQTRQSRCETQIVCVDSVFTPYYKSRFHSREDDATVLDLCREEELRRAWAKTIIKDVLRIKDDITTFLDVYKTVCVKVGNDKINLLQLSQALSTNTSKCATKMQHQALNRGAWKNIYNEAVTTTSLVANDKIAEMLACVVSSASKIDGKLADNFFDPFYNIATEESALIRDTSRRFLDTAARIGMTINQVLIILNFLAEIRFPIDKKNDIDVKNPAFAFKILRRLAKANDMLEMKKMYRVLKDHTNLVVSNTKAIIEKMSMSIIVNES